MVLQLRENKDLEELLEKSKTDPVLIFKHSTQCSISDAVYQEFERFTQTAGELPCGLVLVIENREISNAVASRLGVRHESPQAIVVKNGKAEWNASHWSITAEKLHKAARS
jgi:bacillithiol system protein YtxJ